jgi:hypothetical protein
LVVHCSLFSDARSLQLYADIVPVEHDEKPQWPGFGAAPMWRETHTSHCTLPTVDLGVPLAKHADFSALPSGLPPRSSTPSPRPPRSATPSPRPPSAEGTPALSALLLPPQSQASRDGSSSPRSHGSLDIGSIPVRRLSVSPQPRAPRETEYLGHDVHRLPAMLPRSLVVPSFVCAPIHSNPTAAAAAAAAAAAPAPAVPGAPGTVPPVMSAADISAVSRN